MRNLSVIAFVAGILFTLPGVAAPIEYRCDLDVPDGLSRKDRWDRFEFTQLDQRVVDKNIGVKTYWTSWVTKGKPSQQEPMELKFVDHLPKPRCPGCYEFIARMESSSFAPRVSYFRFLVDKSKGILEAETQRVSVFKPGTLDKRYTQSEIEKGEMLKEKNWIGFGYTNRSRLYEDTGKNASTCSAVKQSSIRGIRPKQP